MGLIGAAKSWQMPAIGQTLFALSFKYNVFLTQTSESNSKALCTKVFFFLFSHVTCARLFHVLRKRKRCASVRLLFLFVRTGKCRQITGNQILVNQKIFLHRGFTRYLPDIPLRLRFYYSLIASRGSGIALVKRLCIFDSIFN